MVDFPLPSWLTEEDCAEILQAFFVNQEQKDHSHITGAQTSKIFLKQLITCFETHDFLADKEIQIDPLVTSLKKIIPCPKFLSCPGGLDQMGELETFKLVLVFTIFYAANRLSELIKEDMIPGQGDDLTESLLALRKEQMRLLIKQKVTSSLYLLGRIRLQQEEVYDTENLGNKGLTQEDIANYLKQRFWILTIQVLYSEMCENFGFYQNFNEAFLARDKWKIDMVTEGCLFWKAKDKPYEEKKYTIPNNSEPSSLFFSFKKILGIPDNPLESGSSQEGDQAQSLSRIGNCLEDFFNYLRNDFSPKYFNTVKNFSPKMCIELSDSFHFWFGCKMEAPRAVRVVLSFSNPYPVFHFHAAKKESDTFSDSFNATVLEYPFSVAHTTNQASLVKMDPSPSFKDAVNKIKNLLSSPTADVKRANVFDQDKLKMQLDKLVKEFTTNATDYFFDFPKKGVPQNYTPPNYIYQYPPFVPSEGGNKGSNPGFGSIQKLGYGTEINSFIQPLLKDGSEFSKILKWNSDKIETNKDIYDACQALMKNLIGNYNQFNYTLLFEERNFLKVTLQLPYLLPQADVISKIGIKSQKDDPVKVTFVQSTC